MNNELLIDLLKLIDKEVPNNINYDKGVDLWKKNLITKKALNWDDKIIEAEKKYLKSMLSIKKPISVYDIVGVINKYNEKLVLWDEDVTNIVVDAIAIPASFDISDIKKKELHEIYYMNGIRLRKKIISIMDDEKLNANEVLITRSYGIFADYILHVNYGDNIKESIVNILENCRVNMIKSVIITCNFSLDDLKIIYDTICEYLDKYEMLFDKVIIALEDITYENELIKYIKG